MKRKKILLIGPPFAGHLHPLLGIGQKVSTVADVIVLTTPKGVNAAKAAGLPAHEIMAEHEHIVIGISEPNYAVKNNPLRLYRQLKENVGLMAKLQTELEAIFLAEKPDLVIVDFVVPVAGLLALRLGIPWWTTIPSPCVIETPDGPPAYFNGQTPARTSLQLLKHAAMRMATKRFKHLIWWLFRGDFRDIGFYGIYRDDGGEAVYSQQRILALGVREIEFECTWPRAMRFVGPMLYTPPYEESPPVFPNDEKRCVLISIGTHLGHAKVAMCHTVRDIAARHPEIMFHFSHGNVSAQCAVAEGNFHEYAYIPYADYLPSYDVVVHHAGAGIMNYCLRHGCPSVVHPIDFDQFDNAARLVAAGVAIAAYRLGDLETAILVALNDVILKEKCVVMSRVMAGYHGAEEIVHLLGSILR